MRMHTIKILFPVVMGQITNLPVGLRPGPLVGAFFCLGGCVNDHFADKATGQSFATKVCFRRK